VVSAARTIFDVRSTPRRADTLIEPGVVPLGEEERDVEGMVSSERSRWARVRDGLVELDDMRERLGALATADGAGCGAAAALLQELDAAIARLEECVLEFESGRRTLLLQLARLAHAA
jgi:hypothetical protein